MQTLEVDIGSARIFCHVVGEGPAVALVPGLGRGARDWLDVAERLAAAGFRAVALEPRGIGGSEGVLEGVSLVDFASDVVHVMSAVGAERFHLAGHAFGHRIASCVATGHPDAVVSLVLVCPGGLVEPSDPSVYAALGTVLDLSQPREMRLAALSRCLFAPGNDASPWLDGWSPDVAQRQSAALAATPLDAWRDAGTAPVLLVQAAHDQLAPAENAPLLAERLGARASIARIDDAGHAMLPEQPAALGTLLTDFFRKHDEDS